MGQEKGAYCTREPAQPRLGARTTGGASGRGATRLGLTGRDGRQVEDAGRSPRGGDCRQPAVGRAESRSSGATKLIGSTARPCFSTSKCRCGPVERPVEPIRAIGLTFLHRVADRDQHALVVRVAGDVAIAVIDLDRLAVAEAILRIGHDAGGDRDDLRAGRAGEVDAAVKGVAAGERIGAMAEVRGDPALRAPAGRPARSAGSDCGWRSCSRARSAGARDP